MQAAKLHLEWIAPRGLRPFSDNNSFENYELVRVDFARGLERVGRQLALKYKSKWHEFWPFLNRFIDLSSCEGHCCLDQHLRAFDKVEGEAEQLMRSSSSSMATSVHSSRCDLRARNAPVKLIFMNGCNSPSRLDFDVYNAIVPQTELTQSPSVTRFGTESHSDNSVFTSDSSHSFFISPNFVFLRNWFETVSSWSATQWTSVIGQSANLRGSFSVGTISARRQSPKAKAQQLQVRGKLFDNLRPKKSKLPKST